MNDPADPLRDEYLVELLERLRRLDSASECFLCGRSILSGSYTREHVIPSWAQTRYKLWNQELVLVNGTSIPYRHLVVPCCDECNGSHLGPLEDSMSATVDEGHKAVKALGTRTLFLWLGKMFYGMLYKELLLLLDRSDPSKGKIITEDFLRQYEMHRLFLQQTRAQVRLLDFEPGSVFVWPAQSINQKELEWDFLDNIDTMFVACRVGSVALFASLADGGAQQHFEDEYGDIHDLPLHPLQFRELAAHFGYMSSLGTRTPKYLMGQDQPHSVIQMPLGGFSLRPLFNDWDVRTYALYLSHNTGIPLDHLFNPPDKVMTWLRKEDGTPNFMSVKDHPPIGYIESA